MLKTTMFGSNRRPFALTVPGIAILILLAGLLWVGSGYKPVSADPLIPPNQVVYTPTFSTANQSKWGPGINVPPATVLSLFDQSWSAGGNTEYKVNFGGDIDFEGYTIPIPSGTFGGAMMMFDMEGTIDAHRLSPYVDP